MRRDTNGTVPPQPRQLFDGILKEADRFGDLHDEAVAKSYGGAFLAEAYRWSQLSYHLHFDALTLRSRRKAVQLCAEFYRHLRPTERDKGETASSSDTRSAGHAIDHVERKLIQSERESFNHNDTWQKQSVFVVIAEVSKNGKRRIRIALPAWVRLQRLDSCSVSRFYFPELSLGLFSEASLPPAACSVIADRELQCVWPFGIALGSFDGELVNKMI